MNSQVIKFVAGGGKTTYASDLMRKEKNGLYIAFTNSVVNDAQKSGHLSLTIDSLFNTFLIPKLASKIPLISKGSKFEPIADNPRNQTALGAKRIKVNDSGELSNGLAVINHATLTTPNSALHSMSYFPNSQSLKYIFGEDTLRLHFSHTAGISSYLLKYHGEIILDILKKRFSYIIIDEAQDLKDYRETFAQLLHQSDLPLILLGDSNQNVNGGGQWFEGLSPTDTKNISFRCPDGVCEWIRGSLGVDIYGTNGDGIYRNVNMNDVSSLDDGARKLLYNSRSGSTVGVIDTWTGPKGTIKSVKGETIYEDVVIVGGQLNHYNLYTAVTRTTKNVYSTVRPR